MMFARKHWRVEQMYLDRCIKHAILEVRLGGLRFWQFARVSDPAASWSRGLHSRRFVHTGDSAVKVYPLI
jgi:hypothetical protein